MKIDLKVWEVHVSRLGGPIGLASGEDVGGTWFHIIAEVCRWI